MHTQPLSTCVLLALLAILPACAGLPTGVFGGVAHVSDDFANAVEDAGDPSPSRRIATTGAEWTFFETRSNQTPFIFVISGSGSGSETRGMRYEEYTGPRG